LSAAVHRPGMAAAVQPPETAVAVQMSGVGVVLDGFRALDRISLNVHRGEWVTVIGPNGAGKSTLLRALGGLVPHSGAVHLFGAPLGRLRRRERARRVAFVPQAPVVPLGMAVLDYVLLGRTPYIQPLARESADDLAAVDLVLDRLDLARFAERRLESLSGGERQRVFLARALAQGATLLLLDEPTAALDIGHQQEVLELVDRLRREAGLTVVTTMHDLSIAGEYADRLVLLAGGHVVGPGEPREVLTEPLLAEHYRAHITIIDGACGPLVVPVRAVTWPRA
jgi:iron complex transport system ATP-binding protein